MATSSGKKKLTRGEKMILVAPLFVLLTAFSVLRFRQRTRPIMPYLTISPAAPISSALLTPDGKTIIVSTDARRGDATSGQVKFYNARTGGFRKTLVVSDGQAVAAMALSRDGQLLACGDTLGSTAIWRLKDNKKIRVFKHKDAQGIGKIYVSSLDFSPDNRVLALTSNDQLRDGGSTPTLLWNVNTGKFIGALGRINKKPKIRYVHRSVRFSPDGKFLACYASARTDSLGKWSAFSKDLGCQLWDARTGAFLRNLPGFMPFEFSPDSKAIAVNRSTPSYQAFIDLLDIKTGRSLWQNSSAVPLTYNASFAPVFSPNGKFIVCAEEGSYISNILKSQDGEKVIQLQPVGSSGSVSRMPKFSSDGKILLTFSYDTICLWNTDDWNK